MRHLSWLLALHTLPLLLTAASIAQAAVRAPAASFVRTPVKATADIRAVTTIAPGQAGYVHYFVLTHPDGTREDHVGIELEDQRIAWSFPKAGVIVSELTGSGTLDVGGEIFSVEHLHGIRPFRTSREMEILRQELPQRVAFWIDNATPYCVFREAGEQFCLNCGDFVARILFPGANPLAAGLPRDFTRALGEMPTSDDLLIYMLGLHNLPDTKSRIARLATLSLPASLRLDVMEMLLPGQATLAASVGVVPAVQPPAEKKPLSRLAIRKTQSKRL